MSFYIFRMFCFIPDTLAHVNGAAFLALQHGLRRFCGGCLPRINERRKIDLLFLSIKRNGLAVARDRCAVAAHGSP